MKSWFEQRYKQVIHTVLTEKHAFEQDFLPLSTYIAPSYYYYLYIEKPAPKRTTQVKPGYLTL